MSAIYSTVGKDENDDKNDDDHRYNVSPELGVRINRSRIGRNTMFENNINFGYNLYNMQQNDVNMTIDKIEYELDIDDEIQFISSGLDFILKGGVMEPSLLGLGVETGGTYILSHSSKNTIHTQEDTSKDIGTYYGGYLMIGDRFNFKIGYRYYNLFIKKSDINREYLNSGLFRISLSFRF